MLAGGEAFVLALAWKSGHDPYRLYNALNEDYRRTTAPHPCPTCYTLPLKQGAVECPACHNRQIVFLPTDELGERRLPPYPARLRAFTYGAAMALHELENKR